jgi:arginine decarboxylase
VPAGIPIMAPGQVITEEALTFLRKLDFKEIDGYSTAQRREPLKPDVLATRKTNWRTATSAGVLQRP